MPPVCVQVWRSGDEVYSDVVFQPHTWRPAWHTAGRCPPRVTISSVSCSTWWANRRSPQPGDRLRAPVELGTAPRHRPGWTVGRAQAVHGRVRSAARRAGQLYRRAVFLVVDVRIFERYGVLANHPGLDWLGGARVSESGGGVVWRWSL